MEQALYTFYPDVSDANATLWTSLGVALLTLAGTVALLRRRPESRNRNAQMLGSMLLFFVCLIAAGTAIFSAWTRWKLRPVRIYADAIETPYGRVGFEEVRTAYIREEMEHSLINPSLITRRYRLLVIEETDGRVHVLSEKNYPLNEILGRLKEVGEE